MIPTSYARYFPNINIIIYSDTKVRTNISKLTVVATIEQSVMWSILANIIDPFKEANDAVSDPGLYCVRVQGKVLICIVKKVQCKS